MDVIKQLSLVGLVPVIKVEDAGDAVPLCRALAAGDQNIVINVQGIQQLDEVVRWYESRRVVGRMA